MIRLHIHLQRINRLLFALAAGLLMIAPILSRAQLSLNVTNFGALGDAVRFYVNTINNSTLITTTNQLSNADIGKTIEIFGVGPQTIGINFGGRKATNYQDLVTTIKNVANGTNIYLSTAPEATVTNAFATYGTDNTPAFSNTLAAAAAYTNVVINIPSGVFLLMPAWYNWYYSAIVLNRGGIHLIGAGQDKTILLGKGAWNLRAGNDKDVWRGFLIEIRTPITNDEPITIGNLTLDGGVPQGNTPQHGNGANPVDGLGWDLSHDACVITYIANVQNGAPTHQVFTNLTVTHWRGEMFKSVDSNTNGNVTIQNCFFNDGNATALNIYGSWNVGGNIFSNLFQIGEYYQAYYTNTSYFTNNYVANITANGFALNGANGNNPPFIISGNNFYFPGNGYNGIMTTPADNVFIVSNNFSFASVGGFAVVLGAAGAQGAHSLLNSNIVVLGNNFTNASQVIQIAGATTAFGENSVLDVNICSNSIAGSSTLIQCFNWSTNIHFFANSVAPVGDPQNGANRGFFSLGAYGSQYAFVDINNNYYSPIYDLNGKTNSVGYKGGSRYEIVYPFYARTIYALTDTDSNQIPSGAQILIRNSNLSSAPIPIYLNSALTRGPVILPYSQTFIANWTNGVWVNAANNANTVAPTVSAITANVTNQGTNSSVLQIPWGTALQLSASASTIAGNNLIWQWSYSINGGPQIASQSGSGTAPISSFTYAVDTGGNTYVWTLRVTDTTTGLSTKSQFTVFVQLQPPQGILVIPN